MIKVLSHLRQGRGTLGILSQSLSGHGPLLVFSLINNKWISFPTSGGALGQGRQEDWEAGMQTDGDSSLFFGIIVSEVSNLRSLTPLLI